MKAIINNLIPYAKLIFKIIFYKELKNKLINNYIFDEQIKHGIKILAKKINTATLPNKYIYQTFFSFFTATRCTIIN